MVDLDFYDLRLKLVLDMITDELAHQINIVYNKLRPVIFLHNFCDVFLHITINEVSYWLQLWIFVSKNLEFEDIIYVHEIQQEVPATGNEHL